MPQRAADAGRGGTACDSGAANAGPSPDGGAPAAGVEPSRRATRATTARGGVFRLQKYRKVYFGNSILKNTDSQPERPKGTILKQAGIPAAGMGSLIGPHRLPGRPHRPGPFDPIDSITVESIAYFPKSFDYSRNSRRTHDRAPRIEAPSLQYLEDVYSTILFKDLVQRNDIRNAEQLELIVRYTLQEIGHPFSAKSIADYLKSERRSVSVDTVYGYLDAAEKACLLHRASREDAIGKRALKFNEKFYAVDHGLREALGFSNTASIDQVLENIVYMELLRRGYDVKIGKAGPLEIDFIARKRGDVRYVQVCYLLASEKTVDREFASLEAVKDNYPKQVLSLDEFPRERNGIASSNLIDWLLGHEPR